MFNINLKSLMSVFLLVTFLNASNDELNQINKNLIELKTSQEYAEKINEEKIKLFMTEIIKKENDIKELENKLNSLKIENKNLEKNINEQNQFLKDIKNELVNDEWSPSDWGTVAIAILTLFLVLFTAGSVYLLRKQNQEQKNTNDKNLDLIKIQNEAQQKQIRLNQIEKQIMNIVNFLNSRFIEKEKLYYAFLNNVIFNDAFSQKYKQDEIHIEKTEDELIVSYPGATKNSVFHKSNFFNLLSTSIKLLGIEKTKELILEHDSIRAELNTFCRNIGTLLFFVEEALFLNYDRKIAREVLMTYTTFLKMAYQLGYVNDNMYKRFKIYKIHNLYSNYTPIIDDNMYESIIYEINVVNSYLNLNIKRNDIKKIEYQRDESITDDYVILLKMELLNYNFILQKDENKCWAKKVISKA